MAALNSFILAAGVTKQHVVVYAFNKETRFLNLRLEYRFSDGVLFS